MQINVSSMAGKRPLVEENHKLERSEKTLSYFRRGFFLPRNDNWTATVH